MRTTRPGTLNASPPDVIFAIKRLNMSLVLILVSLFGFFVNSSNVLGDETPNKDSGALMYCGGHGKNGIGCSSIDLQIENGQVFCIGENDSGQLGIGNLSVPRLEKQPFDKLPVLIGTDRPLTGVTLADVGVKFGCAVVDSIEAWCWGDNQLFQLGNGTAVSSSLAVQVTKTYLMPHGDTSRILKIVIGSNHTCVLRSDGRAYCWGDNSKGQLGVGDKFPHQVPVPVADVGHRIVEIYGYLNVTEAKYDDGIWRRWGTNRNGFSSAKPVKSAH
jgi:hypothetical protein